MTKPDDIPQDAWDVADQPAAAAIRAMRLWFQKKTDGEELASSVHTAIARAIMAEREACADYHDDLAAQHEASRHEAFIQHSNGMLTDFHEMMARVHRRAAGAIRKGARM